MKRKLFLSKQRERELKTTVLIDIKLSRASNITQALPCMKHVSSDMLIMMIGDLFFFYFLKLFSSNSELDIYDSN